MTTRKREKMIKEIVDQEFGPNLTVDEICEGIDFSQRNGVRLTDPLKKKPFFKRPLVLTLANICLILICVLSTFFITRSYSRNIGDLVRICEVLDKDEIEYLNDEGYRYNSYINNVIIIKGEINLYMVIVEKDSKYYCFIKMIDIINNNQEIIVKKNDDRYIFTKKDDFINIGNLNSENEVNLSIILKNIINEYTFQYNPY